MPEDLSTLDNGRYQLQEILGQGGMAIVYKAWDTRLRIDRAIKILAPKVARRKSLRKRFENEARTMARLAHPNIVSVTDVVKEGERFFMVMELVTGGTLWDWVSAHGRMPSQLALDYLIPVLEAMGAAHEAGVIHRDIKPQNIMLTAEGKPKVTDFGIAHVQDLLNTSNLTRTGSVMGTWGYMAPEQRQSAKDVDGRSDIYALGATLYAVVTADLPVDLFAAAQDDEVLDRVPRELHDLVRKATRYRADDRYQDVQEMVAACRSVLTELPPLPEDTPRLGADPDLQPTPTPTPAPRPQPIAATATIGSESAADPPIRVLPIPLRTAAASEETFDFGIDPDIDGAPGTAVPPVDSRPDKPSPDTLAKTPLHTQRHTAVPDVTGSDAVSEPPDTGGPRRRSPLIIAAAALAVGLPLAWMSYSGLQQPGESETEPIVPEVSLGTSEPEPEPIIEPEPEAPEPEQLAVAELDPEPDMGSAPGRGDDHLEAPTAGRPTPAATSPAPQPEREAPAPRQPPTAQPAPKEQAAPQPEAKPDPTPPPEPEPERAAQAPGSVSVQGEVDELRLIDDAGKAWPPGSLPPGSYRIEALFPGASSPTVAGKVEIASGQSRTLNCMAAFKKCK
jgi:serine/threonine protein kinase